MTTIATTKEALAAAKTRMEKAVEDFRKELATVRTAARTPHCSTTCAWIFTGRDTCQSVGTVTVPEATMLVISPWDPGVVAAIDKAIRASDLGLNPTNDGKVVRVPIPAPTEERRKELVKHIHKVLENHRTAVRNIRRDIKESHRQTREG